jgi:hypothetical protein
LLWRRLQESRKRALAEVASAQHKGTRLPFQLLDDVQNVAVQVANTERKFMTDSFSLLAVILFMDIGG